MNDSDLAKIGKHVVEAADNVRLFAPDCFARLPIEWDGHEYEIRVIYYGKADAA